MTKSKQVYCNVCGIPLEINQVVSKKDYVFIQKKWGYFSEKDGEVHTIRLCEHCYDQWVRSFKVPVTIREQTELI